MAHKIRQFFHKIFAKKHGISTRVNLQDERLFVQKECACPSCHVAVTPDELAFNFYVCPHCDHHFRIGSTERFAMLADNGIFEEFNIDLTPGNPIDFPDYENKINNTQQKTGLKEAVRTISCSIEGYSVIIGVMDFAFMGGSMGTVAGEKLTQAIMQGVRELKPVIFFTASGGARMHEGILSLMQMARTSHALALLEKARQPFFVVLTDPTTGGVTASFAMLGDVAIGEHEVLIGFTGKRVIEGTIKQKLPDDFQTAAFQQKHGFIDMVCHRKQLRSTLLFLLKTHQYREVI